MPVETLAAGLLVALPLVLVRYPPMGDLAFHEAGVSLLRHLGDPRFCPPGLYRLNLGEPNQLFHLVAYVLSFAVPTDWACKLVVGATVVATVMGAGRLAAHLGVDRRFALLAGPISLGWMMRWGLVGSLTGLAVMLWSLPTLDRAADGPTSKKAACACAWIGGLYLAHESSMAVCAVASCAFLTARPPRRAGRLALGMSPSIFAGALAVVYHLRSAGLKGPSVERVTPIVVALRERITDLAAGLYSMGRWSAAMLLASLVVLAAFGFWGGASARFWWATRPWRFVSVGLACLAGYLVVPEAFAGSTLVYHRFLAPAFVLLAVSAVAGCAPPRWIARAAWLLPVATIAILARGLLEADRSYRDLDAVLSRMEDGAATAQLNLAPRAPGVVAPVVGAGARALAVHGGRLLFSFTDAPTYPVTMPPDRRWNEPVLRMAMTPFAFAPAYDLTRFRYLLVWEPSTRVRAVLDEALAPEARRVAASGSWLLFESTLPVASIVDGERPLPTPPPVPLATRVKAAMAAHGARDAGSASP
jgi:hypothetical protein